MTIATRLTLFSLAALPISLLAFPALAHNGVNHGTDAEASAHLEVRTPPLKKPLDAVKPAPLTSAPLRLALVRVERLKLA